MTDEVHVHHPVLRVAAKSTASKRVLVALILIAGALGIPHGQTGPPLPTRGIEEVGRTYMGEPLSAYIGQLAMLFVTGKHPTVGNGTMQDSIDWVNDPLHSVIADGTGGLAVYGHPDAASRVLALNGLTGMEVFSQGTLPSNGRDQMWDTVLTTLNSQGKPLIWGFAADNTHTTSGTNWNFAWNVSLVPSVDVFALKHALRTGAFYTSNGPDISSVAVNGTTISLTLAQSSDVLWLRAGQFISGTGTFSQSTSPGANRAVQIDSSVTSSSLNIGALGIASSDLQYVRAIVRTSSTRYALTQPFQISTAGAISNPYPASGTWIKGQSDNHDDAPLDNTTAISTFRNNYAAVGQVASFETASSYWELPYQRLDSDGYPDVFSVLPTTVAPSAFQELTIQGVNFAAAAAVQIGPYPLANVTRVSATTLRGSVPTSVPPGVYDVVVTNPDTTRGTLALSVTVQESTADNSGWRSYTMPTLPWNQTTTIAAIGDAVWVGTMKGAAQFKNGVWSNFIPGPGLNAFSRGIYGITADPAGGMWFSSLGMWFRDAAGTFPWTFSQVPGASEQRWGRMAWDANGQLWVTSRWLNGIAIRTTAGTWTQLTSTLPNTDVTQAITRDQQGNMWVGFSGGTGIWKWTGSSWVNVPVPGGTSGLPNATFASVLMTAPNGDVWAAVQPMVDAYAPEKSGVVRYIGGDPQSTQVFKTPQLPNARITDVVVAQNGDVWFASRAGVARLNTSGQWQTFTSRNSGLVSDIVMAMAEDQAGNMWFATDKGVSSFSLSDFSLFNSGPIAIETGGSGSSTITAVVASPPVSAITFSVTGLPSDTTAAFSPTSCGPPCSTTLTVTAGASAPVGNYPLSVTGTTDANGTRSTSLALTIGHPNRAPTVSSPGSQSSMEGDTVSLAIAATDPDGDPLAYSATGLPAGLAIDAATGIISGTIAQGAAFNSLVTMTVTDPSSATATATFGWTVLAPVMGTRGVEEVGRSYTGEPVSAYIGHLAMLFVTGKHPTIGNGTMQDSVNWVNDPLHSVIADGRGGLAIYAHPDFADRVLLLDGLTGMEVFSKIDLPHALPYQRDQMWDVVNTTRLAQGKPLLWGFAADDTHFTTPGDFDYQWNTSLLPTRTLPALKDALRTGAFYTTNGPGISRVTSTATSITLDLEQPSTVLWLRAGQYNTGGTFTQTTGTGANSAVKIETSVTSSTLDLPSIGLPLSNLQFVRAIVQTSTSSYALTQPFAVSASGTIANPYPTSGIWVRGQTHNHSDAEIGNTTTLATYRAHYQNVGQTAAFETAYSYWEAPYQGAASDGFPDLASVSPASVRHQSLARITITGVNFLAGVTAQLGTYPLSDLLRESGTVLSATVPDTVPAGIYDVVVTNPDGSRGTLALGFTVQDDAPANGGWRTFTAPNLPWNQATSVTAIGDDVWVGTMKGAARYSAGAWSTFTPSGGLNVLSSAIYDIAADPSGGIWFTSTGLWFQDPAGTFPWSFQTVNNPSGLSERWGRMAFDASGRLWVTSRWSEGVGILDPSTGWSRMQQATGLPQDDNQVVARDAAGNMWVGFSGGQGIWKWNGSTWQQVPVPGGATGLPQATFASALTAASNGDVWAAVAPMAIAYNPANSGVVRFKTDGTTEIFKVPQLPQPRVTDILLARNGDVWFASRGGVSRRTSTNNWQTYTTRNSGLVSDIVMKLTEDSSGNIWFATDKGVSVFTPDFTNHTPVITSPGDQTTATGTSVSLAITASDADGDALTYSATGLPSGLSINAVSGVITGSVATAAAASNTVTVTVSDGTASDIASFAWSITGGNQAPVVTNPGNQSSAEGASVNLPISASDPDGNALTYSATGLPTGLTINVSSGVISGTVAFGAAPTNNVVVTANDGSLDGTASFTWTVTATNRAPVVTNPGNQSSAEGASVNLPISASDPDGNTLTYSATGLPTGLTINASSGAISGTVAFGAAPTNNVVVTASDGSLNGTASFTWTVTATNRAPVVTNPGNQTSAEGASVNLPISAADPDGNTLTYSATGLPTGLTINASNGVIGGTVAFTAAGTSNVVVTASDGSLTGTAAFTWTVTNTNRAPVVTNPGNQTSAQGSSVNLPISASDPDGDTLAYSATGLPTGLSINASTGVIGGTVAFSAAPTNSVVVTASDGSLNGTASFTWTVTSVAPSAPTSLVATAVSSSQITLTWTDTSANETGFRIERATKPNGNGSFTEIGTVGPNVTTFTSSGLNASTTYYFRVRAYNSTGTSAYSNTASAATLAAGSAPPAAPSNLAATPGSSSQITLTWLDNSNNEQGFRIERALGASTFIEIASVGANVASYVDAGLTGSTTYNYRVRAYNSAGTSAYSNVATATTLAPPLPPAAPTNLVATVNSSHQITLTWIDNSANENGFRVERSLDSVNFTPLASVGTNVASYVDAGLNGSTTYYYRVQAFNDGGSSAYSNTASATTPVSTDPPAAPSNLSGTANSASQITLTWTDNSNNEQRFLVERALGSGAFSQIASLGANVTTFVDTGLANNTSYRYRVRASNAVGTSSYSNTVTVKTRPK